MGTSSIYDGPKDHNPLLPDDFDNEIIPEKEGDKEQPQEPIPIGQPIHMPWQAVKKAMSQYITGSSSNSKGVVKSYVSASGGTNNLTKSSTSGIRSTVKLGHILSSIKQNGIYKTFENLHIELTGKDLSELFSELVNIISISSNTKEDIVAKNATVEALSEIYEYIEKNNMDIKCLDSLDDTVIDTILCSYISAYIWGKMLNDLQSRFEKYSSTPEKTIAIENEFKLYIRNSVEIQINKISINSINFSDKNIDYVIFDLYKSCYDVLEGSL